MATVDLDCYEYLNPLRELPLGKGKKKNFRKQKAKLFRRGMMGYHMDKAD